jgi:hypothetical protein
MPDPVTGILGAVSVGGSLLQSSASKKATKAQTQAADAGIAEQRAAREAYQRIAQPYIDAGGPALRGLMDLAGLGTPTTNWTAYANSNPALMAAYQSRYGQAPTAPPTAGGGNAGAPYGLGDTVNMPYGGGAYNPAAMNEFVGGYAGRGYTGEGLAGPGMMSQFAPQGQAVPTLEQFAQQYYQQNGGDIAQFTNDPQAAAVSRIEGQPMFQSIARQGEDAILQNASATGGLRGGNTQGALARFRPQLLNQFIQEQYARLAGITELGQNAAAGVGSAGLTTGANIGNLLTQQGLAQAAGAGAQGQIYGNLAGNLGGILAGAFKPAGIPSTTAPQRLF